MECVQCGNQVKGQVCEMCGTPVSGIVAQQQPMMGQAQPQMMQQPAMGGQSVQQPMMNQPMMNQPIQQPVVQPQQPVQQVVSQPQVAVPVVPVVPQQQSVAQQVQQPQMVAQQQAATNPVVQQPMMNQPVQQPAMQPQGVQQPQMAQAQPMMNQPVQQGNNGTGVLVINRIKSFVGMAIDINLTLDGQPFKMSNGTQVSYNLVPGVHTVTYKVWCRREKTVQVNVVAGGQYLIDFTPDFLWGGFKLSSNSKLQ